MTNACVAWPNVQQIITSTCGTMQLILVIFRLSPTTGNYDLGMRLVVRNKLFMLFEFSIVNILC